MMGKGFLAKYIHEGKCMPQEAACLIKGNNPEECMMLEEEAAYDEINQYNTTYTRMIDEELQHIVEILCDGSAKWWLYRNKHIFEHVDKALKNKISVSPELINAIQEFISNYLPADYYNLKRKYPYIDRVLESQGIGNTTSQNQHAITSEAKYLRWEFEVTKAYAENPKLKKYQLANAVHKKLSKEAPEFLKKENGEFNDPVSIARQFRMRDIKKSVISK
jgi:hypothetical protein